MQTTTKILLVAGVLALGSLFFLRANGSQQTVSSQTIEENTNVTIVDGQQIVTIKAKGGYQPQITVVQAGLPTVIRFQTKGTFDCSSAVQIPSLGIATNLPASGTTDVDVGVLSVGTLRGTCAMGMYGFMLVSE